jgi:esterase/lipase
MLSLKQKELMKQAQDEIVNVRKRLREVRHNLNKDINEIKKRLDEINNDIKILKSLKDNIIYCAVVINDIVITTYKKGA